MNNDEITDIEVGLVKWVERVLTPLLIACIIGLTTCAVQSQDTIKNLENAAESQETVVKEVKKAIADQSLSQHKIEIKVTELTVNQQHFKKEIQSIKEQNNRILEAVRGLDK